MSDCKIRMHGCTFEPRQRSTNFYNQTVPHLLKTDPDRADLLKYDPGSKDLMLDLSQQYDMALFHELQRCVFSHGQSF